VPSAGDIGNIGTIGRQRLQRPRRCEQRTYWKLNCICPAAIPTEMPVYHAYGCLLTCTFVFRAILPH